MTNNLTIDDITNQFFLVEGAGAFVKLRINERDEFHSIYSDAVKNFIITKGYEKTKKYPSKALQEEILGLMVAKALTTGKKLNLAVRCAKTANGLEIDLSNPRGECIAVSDENWKVSLPSASFYRPNTQQEMPIPQKGANWELFKKYFKTKTDHDLKLMIGFMVSCFHPTGPYAILVLQGEQGTAKSTTVRMIKELVDPSQGATRSLNKREQDFFIAAKNCHLVSFDNVSHLSCEMSDSLCRLVTGGSFSTRKLYSNDEESLIELRKPVMLNGITDFISRADLVSRSLIVELGVIEEEERRSEERIFNDFYNDRPKLLGVLMDAVASAIKNKPDTELIGLPRLADVVLFCTAAEEGLKWEKGEFYKAFKDNQLNAVLNSLSTDPLAIALREFMTNFEGGRWQGTPTELLNELDRYRPNQERSKSWPTTPSYLSQCLTRLAPNLRKVGINFVGKDRNSNERAFIFEKEAHLLDMHSRSVASPAVLPTLYFPNKEWVSRRYDGHDASDGRFTGIFDS